MASQMEYAPLSEHGRIEGYLRSKPELYVYGLGDLEDDLWPHTEWYGAWDHGEIQAICLVFSKYDMPVIHAISEPENESLFDLVSAIANRLPSYSEIHLGPAAKGALDRSFELVGMIDHWKMALRCPSRLHSCDVSVVEQLGPKDSDALRNLYDAVHQDSDQTNVFDPSMLEIGPYFGVREGNRIISSAGVHVFSPRYGVAAVANVATHPNRRRRGLAQSTTARLCQELTLNVEHIGLNVAQSNEPAIRAYRSIGFEPIAIYQEGYIRRRE